MRRGLALLAAPLILTSVLSVNLPMTAAPAKAALAVTATASSQAPGTSAAALLTAPLQADSGTQAQALAAEKLAVSARAKAAATASASKTAAAASKRAAKVAAKAKARVKKAKTAKVKTKARKVYKAKVKTAKRAKSAAAASARAATAAAQDAKTKTAASATARAKVSTKAWRASTWRSEGETRGARIQLRWANAAAVNRVTLVGAPLASDRVTAAVLTFSNGSSLQLTPNSAGDLSTSFPSRTVSSATLTVEAGAGNSSVALSALRLDSGGSWPTAQGSETITSTHGNASATRDGNLANKVFGNAWNAGSVPTASVRLAWQQPRVLASAVVVGLEQNVVDPAASSADPLRGELIFSDGSRVPIPGITGGKAEPTVVAFTPRVASSVEVKLTRLAPQASVGLREMNVYAVGVTPPRVEALGVGYSTSAKVESCDPAARAASNGKLLLLCPKTGSAVGSTATVAVRATAGSLVTARAWTPTRGIATVGRATATTAGIATFALDTRAYPNGPLTIGLVKGDSDATRPFVYAQLVNRGGTSAQAQAPGRSGMTLQWEDDFKTPLSVSSWGEGASYAAVKPEYWGEGAFSDAVFAKPEWGEDTLSTDDGYLRIRSKSIGARQDPNGWGRKHVGGIMASMRVGGSGFSAQHGYFEARMLGAPGKGSWPAFWMLDSLGSTRPHVGGAETDAVELYGHSTLGSCHTIHTWIENPTGAGDCPDPNGFGDWALGWHTYGVQIVPNGADFYIDGKLVTSKRGQDFTDRPMYFMLNQALGGGWPVDLSPTDETADLWVDWVRVYT